MLDINRLKNNLKTVFTETYEDDNLTADQYLDLFCAKLATVLVNEVRQGTVTGVQPGAGTATIT